jgi:hypothetical protein
MTTRAGVATLLGIGDRLFGVVAITANDAWTVGAMLIMASFFAAQHHTIPVPQT